MYIYIAWKLQGAGVIVWIYLSRHIPVLSITELSFTWYGYRVFSDKCNISHAWGFNLVDVWVSRVPKSQLSHTGTNLV